MTKEESQHKRKKFPKKSTNVSYHQICACPRKVQMRCGREPPTIQLSLPPFLFLSTWPCPSLDVSASDCPPSFAPISLRLLCSPPLLCKNWAPQRMCVCARRRPGAKLRRSVCARPVQAQLSQLCLSTLRCSMTLCCTHTHTYTSSVRGRKVGASPRRRRGGSVCPPLCLITICAVWVASMSQSSLVLLWDSPASHKCEHTHFGWRKSSFQLLYTHHTALFLNAVKQFSILPPKKNKKEKKMYNSWSTIDHSFYGKMESCIS